MLNNSACCCFVTRRCLSRLAALEHRLEVELAQSGKGTAAIASTSHFVRVTMEDRPQMPALGHGPPQRAKGDVEVLDPTFAALDDTMDPVPFLETTWNLVLVAGHASVGWIDLVIAWLLLIASAGMQIAFCAILLTPSFLGDPFDEAQVTVAQEWRNSAAHDWKYMDLAKTSLTARVCNNDGGLILSNTQAWQRSLVVPTSALALHKPPAPPPPPQTAQLHPNRGRQAWCRTSTTSSVLMQTTLRPRGSDPASYSRFFVSSCGP